MQVLIKIIQKIITNPNVEAFVIIALTSFFKKKIMQTKPENTIESKNPLFLPRGSIRALLTLILTALSIAGIYLNIEVPAEFHALTIFSIGYYVGYRTDNTQLPQIK